MSISGFFFFKIKIYDQVFKINRTSKIETLPVKVGDSVMKKIHSNHYEKYVITNIRYSSDHKDYLIYGKGDLWESRYLFRMRNYLKYLELNIIKLVE
jgi:hypothetical protein